MDLELCLFWISDFGIFGFWNSGFWNSVVIVVRGAALAKGGVDLPKGERVATTTVTIFFSGRLVMFVGLG